ncbi:hypothetical protein EC973_003241 [Apophysomyces ossiformis]|uniref:SB domain-containing protein n=1 Tax=Apophysomyces ossiformis TaxID=679940 RepID=A0A8H7EU81_9FUNG|nr:hypothetical protein EC973_003241 [Apophysomyces ossiformis]
MPASPQSLQVKDPASQWTDNGTAYYNIQQELSTLTLSPTAYTSPNLNNNNGSIIPKSSSVPVMSSSPSLDPKSASPSIDSHERDFQERLQRKIADRMQHFNLTVSREMDKLLVTNRQLNEGEMHIENEYRRLLDVRERLCKNLEMMTSKAAEVEDVTATVNTMPDVAVDEALCGTTVVYNQMFELVADDNAIVDTIYYLAEALSSERIDLATFMKCTRSLAREQFMKRALMKKISEAR